MLEDWLGEIVETMEDAGVFEDTAFIILSDHGQVSLTMEHAPMCCRVPSSVKEGTLWSSAGSNLNAL